MWKKRTPRLGGPCPGLDDEDDDVMDTSTDFGDGGGGNFNGLPDTNTPSLNGSLPIKHGFAERKHRIKPLSEDEYSNIVDRLEAMCQKELWGTALKTVDELVARRCNEKVLEMKAQILMELRRDYDAAMCCEGAIKLNPLWWEAHRTHGRALLAFGEPQLALKSFQRALRINPADEELREELNWIRRNTEGSVPSGEDVDFTKLVKKR